MSPVNSWSRYLGLAKCPKLLVAPAQHKQETAEGDRQGKALSHRHSLPQKGKNAGKASKKKERKESGANFVKASPGEDGNPISFSGATSRPDTPGRPPHRRQHGELNILLLEAGTADILWALSFHFQGPILRTRGNTSSRA